MGEALLDGGSDDKHGRLGGPGQRKEEAGVSERRELENNVVATRTISLPIFPHQASLPPPALPS